MDPATIAAVLGGIGGIAKGFGAGGGGSSGPGVSVQVSQNNSQNQAVNIGSNPYIPPLAGNAGDVLEDLYSALGVSTPSGMNIGDNRYSASVNWGQVGLYVAIGLIAYFAITKLRV